MTRLEKLQELEAELHKQMQKANSRSIAAIARQYRETIREIEEIQGAEARDDDIAEIMSERQADGKSRAVRTDRTGI